MDETDITQLLKGWVHGDEDSLNRLMPLVYAQLRKLAVSAFRGERQDHTLQTTALVHEAYARLVGADVDYKNRSHFYALAARVMRRILVDHAKSKYAAKRGGRQADVPLEDAIVVSPDVGEEVLDLHEALDQLGSLDPRKAEILEMHYFGGLTYAEMSEVLGIGSSTLDREMRFAKAWMRTQLSAPQG